MLTIIVPTYQRPAFLRRMLEYYANQLLDVPLMIADSSDGTALSENSDAIAQVSSSLQVSHLTFPGTTPFADKLRNALAKVRTPLVVIGADDDFFVPEGLREAAEFLYSNVGYQAVHGQAIAFSIVPSHAAHGEMNASGPYAQYSVEAETGARRLLEHLSRYGTTWYSVHRTDSLRSHFSAMDDMFDVNFLELLPSALTVIAGPTRRLDRLYMVRQSHSAKHYDSRSAWYLGSGWGAKYERAVEILSVAIASTDGLDPAPARAAATQALQAYLTPFVMDARANAPRPLLKRLRDFTATRIGRLIPGPTFPTIDPGLSVDFLRQLLSPDCAHYADFAPIYAIVTRQLGGARPIRVSAVPRQG